MDLKDKIAIITGGASGLGEATLRRFVAHGARCAIFDMNEERGAALVDELGDNVIYQQVNVTDEASVGQAIHSLEVAFGPAHICCNYAGIAWAAKTYHPKNGPHPLEDFKRVVDVNLIGTFNVSRLAAESMIKNDPITDDGQRGVIINTASVAGYEGQIGQVA